MGEIIDFKTLIRKRKLINNNDNHNKAIDIEDVGNGKDDNNDESFFFMLLFDSEIISLKNCIDYQIQKNVENHALAENEVYDYISIFLKDIIENEEEQHSQYTMFVHIYEFYFIMKAVDEYLKITDSNDHKVLTILKNRSSIYKKTYHTTLSKNYSEQEKLDIIDKDWTIRLKNCEKDK